VVLYTVCCGDDAGERISSVPNCPEYSGTSNRITYPGPVRSCVPKASFIWTSCAKFQGASGETVGPVAALTPPEPAKRIW
jgi:hypothetical protein